MKPIYLSTPEECSNFVKPLSSKPAFLLIFVYVMQNIAVTVGLHSSDYPGNETDHGALLAIKNQLVDHPNGVLSSWNNSVHHCKWGGVICGCKHKRVTLLDLSFRGLGGTISPFIGNLSFLKIIRLHNNSLYGQIPSQLSHIFRLQVLMLYNNTLTGEIPANISRCDRLKKLSLGRNKLEGKLPAGLGALSELILLAMHYNNLSGPLFGVIQNLTSLVMLSAAENSFTGTIPNSIGRIQNINFLSAGENELSGTLPTSVFNLSSLQGLVFQDNQLHGKLPAQMGSIPGLELLYLSENNFSGIIPTSIRNLTSLESVSLHGNGFTGRVPQDFGHFPNLTTLLLSENNLLGDINFLTTLVNCTHLKFIDLEDNYFTGILPDSVANLSTTLTWLSVGNSLISGILPAAITNLINLKRLCMNNIKLMGILPHDFGKLQKLEVLDLSSNRLTGRIPYSMGNLSRLSLLDLSDNILKGSIPESIGNCKSLLCLYLENNNFSGNIPRGLFEGPVVLIYIDFTFNQLKGSLPFEISKQINLVGLGMSNNKLSGVIPDGLSACTALQYLLLNGNSFCGHIPPSLTSLSSLLQMDVSQNHLSGQIPAYFSNFSLIYLNLSYNDFEGRVPTTGVFSNGSVVFLDGNKKLCGGIQELHLPKCIENKTMGTMKRSMSYAIKKVVISSVCALVGVLAMSLGLYLLCRRKKRHLISSALMTGKTFTKVSYDNLLKATAGFSSENLLGRGSFGSVFKGNLDGKMVAVKVLNLQHRGASKSFIAECKALREVRHRNLVGIITICSSIDFQRNDFRALVYEFMPNGSLDKWLSGVVGNMSLAQRVDVAIDVAHALNYLHHECEIPIVHCDLKPSNILLDNDMVARVGDFGLSKFLSQPRHSNQSGTIGIRGTIGYAAPEYGLGNETSIDGDVYSYGILLLELMTGKSPTDKMFKEDYHLQVYAEEALPDQVLQIVDPSLDDDNLNENAEDVRAVQDELQRREECIITMLSVGVSCSNHLPHNRMKITDAISRLQLAKENLLNVRRNRNFPAKEA